MDRLLLVKLGGSVVTDKSKPYTPNLKNIRRFATEIKKKFRRGEKLVIIHGQGSFAHLPAKKYRVGEGMTAKNRWGIAETEFQAVEINRVLLREFLLKRIPVVTFSPMSLFLAKDKHTLTSNLGGLHTALNRGLVPVLYGDVIMDGKQGVCIYSGERVITEILPELIKTHKIEKIVYVSDVLGVLDSKGHVIPKITTRNFKKVAVGSMLHKVEESLKLAKKYGLTVVIGNNIKGIKGTKIFN